MAVGLLEGRLQRTAEWLWGLVLLTMPVTTFRYLPGVFGQAQMKPLAFYPLFFLVLVLGLLFWRRRQLPLPPNARPLLAFLLFALLSSAAGLLLAPIPLRGFAYEDRVLRAWLSLLIGLVFFAAAFAMNRSEADLRRSLRWLYTGLAATLLWSLVQALALHTPLINADSIETIQLAFGQAGFQSQRVMGFAFEASWLADQLVLLYMPWLLAALLSGYTLFRRSYLEAGLLALTLLVLLLTYSRAGLLIALASAVVVLLALGRPALARLWAWFARPLRRRSLDRPLAARLALLLLVFLAALGGLRYLAGIEYIASAFDIAEDESLVDYFVDISAGPRLAYAQAGYQVFEAAPFTGVGFGAAGLYLFDNYPAWSHSIPEIVRQLAPDSSVVPNTKSLYVRLLAETGLPGFWLFTVFLFSFLALLRRMWLAGRPHLMYAATAGLFGWVGLGLRNLTQDSLTFPIMWVLLGMLAGLAPSSEQKEI